VEVNRGFTMLRNAGYTCREEQVAHINFASELDKEKSIRNNDYGLGSDVAS